MRFGCGVGHLVDTFVMFLENCEKMAMKMVLEFMKIASGRLGGKDKKETVDEI